MDTFGNKKGAYDETIKKYYCENCNFECNKKYSWDRHLKTNKHLEKINKVVLETKNDKFKCEICNRCYKNRSGLWKHKKKCQNINTNDIPHELFVKIINENIKLNDLIIEKENIIAELLKYK